ncbi:MAG: class I SAM-dependent methyltransferase [Thermoleophilaceae bacterium]
MQGAELNAMIELDDRHWWYRGRRRVVTSTLDRLELPVGAEILDAGCGSGRTLDDLIRYGSVTGIDPSRSALDAARARGHSRVFAGHLERLPFEDASFDLVTCLDVLEHTASDVVSLRELRRISRPGARLVVTVPAYQLLWSRHDDANLHYRRYRRGTLRESANVAGWSVERTSYFNSLLLPPAALVRLAERVLPRSRRARSDLRLTPRALDPVLAVPMYAEALLMRAGVKLPAGLSLLAVLVNRPPAGLVEIEWPLPEPAAAPRAVRQALG